MYGWPHPPLCRSNTRQHSACVYQLQYSLSSTSSIYTRGTGHAFVGVVTGHVTFDTFASSIVRYTSSIGNIDTFASVSPITIDRSKSSLIVNQQNIGAVHARLRIMSVWLQQGSSCCCVSADRICGCCTSIFWILFWQSIRT